MPNSNRAVLLAYLPFALLVCLLGVKLIMTAVAAPSRRWGEVQRLISRVTGDVDFVGFHIPSRELIRRYAAPQAGENYRDRMVSTSTAMPFAKVAYSALALTGLYMFHRLGISSS